MASSASDQFSEQGRQACGRADGLRPQGSPRIVLVHLSDIHFRRSMGPNQYTDADDVRNETVQDLANLLPAIGVGSAHGILVSGDIAFSGKTDEYEVGYGWLRELCRAIRCPEEYIWTVPGNHDVDRSLAERSAVLRTIQHTLREVAPRHIDGKVAEYLADPMAATLLFQPIQNYSTFAGKYGCDFSSAKQYWEHRLLLNDNSVLALRGLNSTLVSSSTDNDTDQKLLLPSECCTLRRQPGVEYLTVCHHPPQWLRNEDVLETKLRARSRIQLFGHKHLQQVYRINECIRLHAGAVNPDSGEHPYDPRFNCIMLHVEGVGATRMLVVEIFPRVWDDQRKRFTSGATESSSPSLTYRLGLDPWTATATTPMQTVPPQVVQDPFDGVTNVLEGSSQTSVGRIGMNPSRRLAYRFLALPYHRRVEVAQELGLLRDEDDGIPNTELFRRFFERAKQMGKLAHLWRAVERRHADGRPDDNPFGSVQEA